MRYPSPASAGEGLFAFERFYPVVSGFLAPIITSR